MRLLGSFLLAICCLLWGVERVEEVKAHLHRLEAAELFWRGLRAELQTRRATPRELFASRAESYELCKTLPFLPRVLKLLEQGEPYPRAFAKAMAPRDQWKPEELACQQRLGSVVGQLPLEEQLDALDLLVETLGGYREKAKIQLGDQCRFYRSLSLAAGAAVIILLI